MSNVAPGSVPVSGPGVGAANPAVPVAPGQGLAGQPAPAPTLGQDGKPVPKRAITVEQIKAARAAAAITGGTGQGGAAPSVPGSGNGDSKAGGNEPAKASGTNPDGSPIVSDPSGPGSGKEPKKDETLTQFVGLRRDLETANKKWKEHEPVIELGKKFEAAQKLAKEGKNYDAIIAAGFDFDAAAAEIMAIDPDSLKPNKELDEQKARLDKLEADRKAEQDAVKAEQVAAEKERGRVGVRAWVKEQKAKFPLLSRNDIWVDKALATADKAYEKIVASLGPDAEISNEEKQQIITSALERGEQYRTEQRKLYADETQAEPEQARTQTITGDIRGGLNGRPNVVGKMTLEQLRAKNRARL